MTSVGTVTTSTEGSLCAVCRPKLSSNDESEQNIQLDSVAEVEDDHDYDGIRDAITEEEGVGDSAAEVERAKEAYHTTKEMGMLIDR